MVVIFRLQSLWLFCDVIWFAYAHHFLSDEKALLPWMVLKQMYTFFLPLECKTEGNSYGNDNNITVSSNTKSTFRSFSCNKYDVFDDSLAHYFPRKKERMS
jgi:hypothetical protein